jgi:hypothetical protein
MDVSCASQEDVGPKLALRMRPLLLHATTEVVGGGTGRTTPGVSVHEGVRGVPLAAPPASAASDLMKKRLRKCEVFVFLGPLQRMRRRV